MTIFTNKFASLSATIFAIALGVTTTATAAPVLDIQQGQLIGINNIDLGGTWGEYDVSFNPYSSGIEFYAEDFALQANIALLEMFTLTQYFQGHDVDMIGPTSTKGCDNPNLCAMLTPTYKTFNQIQYDGVYNRYGTYDYMDSRTQGSTVTLPGKDYMTFSTWSKSALVGEVPIPAAAFMFAPALLGFMGLRRRAKNKAS